MDSQIVDFSNYKKEIENAFSSLSPEEKKVALSILREYNSKGQSEQLQKLIFEDYDEIPVTIDEFLDNPIYLGAGTFAEGKSTIFPYWRETLRKIFPDNIHLGCNTLVLSGAIGLGKSFIAVICMLYMLYRMLCLKNPYLHYGLQPIDKITFSFINITLDAAKGVAWSKCQELLQSSAWFMSKGVIDTKDTPEWHAPKEIELLYGSLPKHVIGRAIFCLDGDTIITTTEGDYKLSELSGKQIQVLTLSPEGSIVPSDVCSVQPTIKSTEEYSITLEDGTTIKCTPNHRFLLTSGEYKEARDLSESDDIVSFNPDGYVYKTTNLITNQVDKIEMRKVNEKSMRITRIEHHILSESKQFYDVVEASPFHNFLIKTNTSHVVSHNCSFEDEVSFQQNQDIEKQKEKAKVLINSIDARMQSRFMKGEKIPTLHILASSKRTDQSFLETYIDTKKKNESKTTLVIDEPQWVVRNDKDSPKKFHVAVGNKFLESCLIPLNASEKEIQTYRDKGYQILDVPMGYLETFRDNLDVALTDVAGISTTNAMKYISGARWASCKKDYLTNPFTKEIIETGDDTKDTAQYFDFFDMNKVDRELMSKPLYVHLDMSISGDKTGIAGVWIIGKRLANGVVGDDTNTTASESKELYYRLVFSTSIKAPKGHQISFEKNRNFIYWLKEQGFNIKGITTDTFQSYDTGQALKARNYPYDVLSVDRVDTDRICKPYQYLKSTVYENRIEVYETKLLTEEVIGLERNNNGKVDHANGGTTGSKDQIDAVCGAVFNASQHSAEYAYDFGEDAVTMVELNGAGNGEIDSAQLTLDLEEELKKMGPTFPEAPHSVVAMSTPINKNKSGHNPDDDIILGDGILIW